MVEVNRAKRTRNTIIYHVLVIGIGIFMIYPILWLGGSSLKPDGEIWTRMSAIFPLKPTLQHYTDGWKGFGNISFAIFLQEHGYHIRSDHPGPGFFFRLYRLWIRQAPLSLEKVLVRLHAGHPDATPADSADSPVHHVLQAALDQQFQTYNHSQLFRARLFHLHDRPVYTGGAPISG